MRKNLVVLLASLTASVAFAQGAAGVSDERVVLPGAPGSIDGVGENAQVSGNQGSMTYVVKIETPNGFDGLSPNLALSYSSSGGAGLLGFGWSIPSYSIQRMTSKGLQKYDANDRIAVDGSDELVKITMSGADPVYRARFESGFIRWTWKNQGTGEGGYWKAEYPDGRVGYFGADKTGADVPTAQVKNGATKIWKWHLVEMTDQFNHSMKYSWTKDSSGYPLLDRVDYVFDGTTPRHGVAFVYEARTDIISDATPGFELKLNKRLKEMRIFSGTEVIRSYALAYESDMVAGFATRLQSVTRFGRGNAMYPVKFNFGYTKTLSGVCDTSCEKPFVADMGTLGGVDFSNGKATLIDMNGDALPDVIFSPTTGNHRIYTSKLDSEGKSSFNMTPTTSAQTTSSFVLGEPRTQVIDVNGDGFTDISRAGLGILCNNGSGDWQPAAFCAGGIGNTDPGASFVADDTDEPSQADPKYVRFFDYDNDRRIDYLRTTADGLTTEVLANTASGFVVAPNVQNIGIGVFDVNYLQLADMNGDGLQDPVNVVASGPALSLQYRLNLGFGQWAPPAMPIILSGFDTTQVAAAQLQDINGDGLADVVVVTANEVRYALNRNAERFDAVRVLTSTDLAGGSIPLKGANTTVVFADMNANGSDDIVWIQPSGLVQYLELFPVRPNLISRIDNNIGAVQLFAYGTSVKEQVRDTAAGKPWANRVPNAYTLVTETQSFVTLTGSDSGGLKEIERMRYHSGFYDGVEKQFRGYEGVERELVSDMSRDSQEPGLLVESYDVGKTSPILAGSQLRMQSYVNVGATPTLLQDERNEMALCDVAQVTGATPLPKFACRRARTTTFVERDPGNAVTVQAQWEYDGYGNVTLSRQLGVVNKGTVEMPSACEACTSSGEFGKPCGMTCEGDEQFVASTYVEPGANTSNAWILNRKASERVGAVANMYKQEAQWFYDGADFEGLPLGQLTKGAQSRYTRRTGPGANDFLNVKRVKRDTHGNVVEEISPLGTVADATNHRRVYTYEAAGLNQLSTEVRLGATALRRDYVFDTVWEKVTQSSNWVPVVNGQPVASGQISKYRYDEHGRVNKLLDPGDAEATPGSEFSFQLASPASRILEQRRSVAGGGCRHRLGQVPRRQRPRVSGAHQARRRQVAGQRLHRVRRARRAVSRKFVPYLGTTGDCDMASPTNVPFTKYTYDALGRELVVTLPDGATTKTE